jgi:hypothetical protein
MLKRISYWVFIFILLMPTLEINAQYSSSEYYVTPDTLYNWEKTRTTWSDCNDMVLLYGGGSHRWYVWDDQRIAPYVTAFDDNGNENWLFDSYLFLEIKDGALASFTTGFDAPPATQADWKKLVDYFFQKTQTMGALNKAIGNAILRIGSPKQKHKIVIGIPEPIKTQTSWGSVKDGIVLNFANANDRVDACKWYIDYVRKKFSESGFTNLELAGFYWIAEEASNSRILAPVVGEYINSLKYSFNWIPYFNSPGWMDWKTLRFNYAYLQPNYFFKEPLIESRLDDACKNAISNGMDMEMEFDERILTKNNSWHYRLDNYIEAFTRYGIKDSKRIAYYQGSKALYELSVSTDSADRAIYRKFCNFVINRNTIDKVVTNWTFSNATTPTSIPLLKGTTVPLMSQNSGAVRNMAVGKMNSNDRVFLFTREDNGRAKVLIYDAENGAYVDSLRTGSVIKHTGVGNLVSIGDGDLTEDGKLLLANVVGPKTGQNPYDFRVYKWDHELQSAPQVVINYYTGTNYPTGRYGDKILVTGSYRDGTACVYATNKYYGFSKVLRWSMQPDPANPGQFVFSNTPEELFTVYGKSIQSSLCRNAAGDFYYKESERPIVKFSAGGDSVDVSTSALIRKWGTTVKFVGNIGNDDLIAYFRYRSRPTTPVEPVQERVDLLRIPNGKLSEAQLIATTPTLGPEYNLNGWGDLVGRRAGNNVELFVLSATNGFAKFTVNNVFTTTGIGEKISTKPFVRKTAESLIVEGEIPELLELYNLSGQLVRLSHHSSFVSTSGLKGIYLLRVVSTPKQAESIKVAF